MDSGEVFVLVSSSHMGADVCSASSIELVNEAGADEMWSFVGMKHAVN
jgi:hypothetical protein